MFGEFVRALRQRKELGLREFCQKLKFDPSNWSKVERGILAPPKEPEILKTIADALDLVPESADWQKLHDSAMLERGRLPTDIMEDSELVEKLPVFFRTIRGQKPTKADLLRLAELIRRG